MQAQIIGPDMGFHNSNQNTIARLVSEGAYKDQSTILIVPAFGSIPTKVVSSWLNTMWPPNQRIVRLFAVGMEVGAAYSDTIQMILDNPDLSKYKYLAFLEHDNIIQPDCFLQLIAALEANPRYSIMSGAYFTKGPGGVFQAWGSPDEDPVVNFRPQPPRQDGGIMGVYGTGMGACVMRMSMFKDERLRKPWFKTTCSTSEGAMTQDLHFAVDARKHGHRAAVHCGVKVGHYDLEGKFGQPDFTW